MNKIIKKIKRLWQTTKQQLALHAYDCDGMCNHCPKDYRTICQTFKNQNMSKKKDPLKMIQDAQKAGIPVFVLVAKDRLSTEAIQQYWASCDLESCDPQHIVGVQEILNDFETWQRNNYEQVKLPD